jgi:hypothetical protein
MAVGKCVHFRRISLLAQSRRASGPFQYLLQDDLAHSDESHRWVIVTNQQTVPRGDLARELFCIHRAHAKFRA